MSRLAETFTFRMHAGTSIALERLALAEGKTPSGIAREAIVARIGAGTIASAAKEAPAPLKPTR